MDPHLVPWCFQDIQAIIYVFWVLLLLSTLTTAICNLSATCKLLKLNSKSDKSRSALSIMCILIAILFAASGTAYGVHTAQSIFCSDPISWTNSGCFAIDCYMLALSLLYMLYVFRLKFIFQDTKYALSTQVLLWFLLGFLFQIVCIFIATLFLLKNNINIGLKAYSVFNASNFFFNMILISLFIRRIHVLCQNAEGLRRDDVESQSLSHIKKHTMNAKKLLSPAIRYVICAFVSLLSSNLLSTFGIIRAEILETQALRMLHILLIVMDQGVNSYFLYLQYPFGDEQYHKRCHVTHEHILGCFTMAIDSEKDDESKTSTVSTNDVTTAVNSDEIQCLQNAPNKQTVTNLVIANESTTIYQVPSQSRLHPYK
eukprot:433685_1